MGSVYCAAKVEKAINMDPMDMENARIPEPGVDSTSASAHEETSPRASETPDSDANKELTEQPNAAPATWTLDDLAVTTPLKALRAKNARSTIDLNLAEATLAEGEAEKTPESDLLTPGATLAGYTIERLLRTEEEGPVYLATPPSAPADTEDAGTSEAPPPWRYIAREVPASDAERVERVVAAGVREPGLLAPVALVREQGRAYLIGVELPGAGARSSEPATPLGTAERLRPVDALTACSQLANSLAALHMGELAHLRVSPDRVTLYDGRVYLAGIEGATPITDPEESQTLYARDANFLARTVGALGGADDVTLWDHDTSAQRSLREIAARGAAGGFATIEEVAEASSLALQLLAVAGASMGADVRSVRLRIRSGAASSVGRVRAENQDAWAATIFDIRDDASADAPLGVFLVADGMGGEAHGEIASRLVARVVTAEMARRFLEPRTAWPALAIFTAAADDATTAPQLPLAQTLEQAVKEANRRTRAFGARLNATTGSTVTALAVAGARAALAHLGDSRAYLLRDGQLLQLTEDHSLVARLEAMRHPLLDDPSFMVPRSVLYRSIGQEDDTSPDMLQFVLAPGDRLALCSDGLWDELSSERIGQTLGEAPDPDSCATELVALANASGGHDNSTAVVLFVYAEPFDQPIGGAAPEDLADAMPEGMLEDTSGAMPEDMLEAILESMSGELEAVTPEAEETVASEVVASEIILDETVTPEAATPEAATDETVAPEAVADEAASDEAVTPVAVADEAATPAASAPRVDKADEADGGATDGDSPEQDKPDASAE